MKKHSQQGSALVILTALLGLALIATVGWIFWHNASNKPVATANTPAAPTQKAQQVSPEQTATGPKTEAVTTPAATSKFVVLKTWGVKFDAPTDGTSVTWATAKDATDTIGFSTSNLTKGDLCTAANGAAGSLERSSEKISTTTGTTTTLLNKGKPIAGHYYAFSLPNGPHCTDTNPSDYAEAQKIQGLVKTLVAE